MKKILIIDDSEDIVEVLKFILVNEGYDIQTAIEDTTPQITKAWKPDLIILDVYLKKITGIQIAKNLQNNRLTKDIPILMMSAHPNIKEDALLAGNHVYLEKPFSSSSFIKTVDLLIGK